MQTLPWTSKKHLPEVHDLPQQYNQKDRDKLQFKFTLSCFLTETNAYGIRLAGCSLGRNSFVAR